MSITTATGTSAEGAAASVGFNVTLDAAAGKDMYVKYVLSTDSGDYTNDMAEEERISVFQMRWQTEVFLIPAMLPLWHRQKRLLLTMMISTNIPRILLLIWRPTTDATAALTVNNLAKTYTYTITEADASNS